MVRVPTYDRPRYGPNALPAVRQDLSPTAATFGSERGARLAEAGEALTEISDTVAERAAERIDRLNETTAEETYTKWLGGMTDLTTEFQQLHGLDAAGALEDFQRRADDLRASTVASLGQRARNMALQQIDRKAVEFAESWGEHSADETRVARLASLRTRMTTAADAAIALGPRAAGDAIMEITALTARKWKECRSRWSPRR